MSQPARKKAWIACAANAECCDPAEWVALPCHHSVCTTCRDAFQLADGIRCGACNRTVDGFSPDRAVGEEGPASGGDADRATAEMDRLAKVADGAAAMRTRLQTAMDTLAEVCCEAAAVATADIDDRIRSVAEEAKRKVELLEKEKESVRAIVERHYASVRKRLDASEEASKVMTSHAGSLLRWARAKLGADEAAAVVARLASVRDMDCDCDDAVQLCRGFRVVDSRVSYPPPQDWRALLAAGLQAQTSMFPREDRNAFLSALAADDALLGNCAYRVCGRISSVTDATKHLLVVCAFTAHGTRYYVGLLANATRPHRPILRFCPDLGLSPQWLAPAVTVRVAMDARDGLVVSQASGDHAADLLRAYVASGCGHVKLPVESWPAQQATVFSLDACDVFELCPF
jgi:hypothetical protein